MTTMRIFIGWDDREAAAYHVFCHSIIRQASSSVSIEPLVQRVLRSRGLYTRAQTGRESTAFSMTRFLVPALCDYKGFALFADCDMLARCDVHEIFDLARQQPDKAVWVAQHCYRTKVATKFCGAVQEHYPCKNWSSLVLFDCSRCRTLTPQHVNAASGLELHRFLWLDVADIGSLPIEYNWLVGEYDRNDEAKILHYTLGGPWFGEYAKCDHADLWFKERDRMLACMQVAATH